jgi:hypothetical protein
MLAEKEKEMRKIKCGVGFGVFVVVAVMAVLGALSGCSTVDKAYRQEVGWTNAPVVQVVTNVVVVTKVVPGEPGGASIVVPVATNFVPVFYTNVVQVPVTNLVARPEAVAAIEATGSIVNTFMPGAGSLVALALGGVYHGYRRVRNRRVAAALIQGVETARAVLTAMPQGQKADAQFVKWLMEHQKEAGVFTTVSGLVEQLADNPAARMAAQEIAQRLQRAQQPRAASPAAVAAS